MAARKVRVGSWYAYNPVMLDNLHPPVGLPQKGDIVQVFNLYGCPKANSGGTCYIQNGFREFLGMCCTNSLLPMKKVRGHWVMVEEK